MLIRSKQIGILIELQCRLVSHSFSKTKWKCSVITNSFRIPITLGLQKHFVMKMKHLHLKLLISLKSCQCFQPIHVVIISPTSCSVHLYLIRLVCCRLVVYVSGVNMNFTLGASKTWYDTRLNSYASNSPHVNPSTRQSPKWKNMDLSSPWMLSAHLLTPYRPPPLPRISLINNMLDFIYTKCVTRSTANGYMCNNAKHDVTHNHMFTLRRNGKQ